MTALLNVKRMDRCHTSLNVDWWSVMGAVQAWARAELPALKQARWSDYRHNIGGALPMAALMPGAAQLLRLDLHVSAPSGYALLPLLPTACARTCFRQGQRRLALLLTGVFGACMGGQVWPGASSHLDLSQFTQLTWLRFTGVRHISCGKTVRLVLIAPDVDPNLVVTLEACNEVGCCAPAGTTRAAIAGNAAVQGRAPPPLLPTAQLPATIECLHLAHLQVSCVDLQPSAHRAPIALQA